MEKANRRENLVVEENVVRRENGRGRKHHYG